MEIEWNKRYEVGNLEIDAEHKVFVQIIQKIYHAIEGKLDRQYLERLVLELFKYADFHFCSEENVMFTVNYPELDTHQQEHKKLLIELKTIIPALGESEGDLHELVEFLMRWFSTHTIIEDLKVADYVKRRKGMMCNEPDRM